MSDSFKFKRFTVKQDRCAMKVGTDGVLLGAWTSLDIKPNTMLDIGAGTGVIALQLAQRSQDDPSFQIDLIDAVELDSDAYEQCVENFEDSPWNDLLFCYHSSLQEFAEEIDIKYDLIVSNPPFYSDEYLSKDPKRSSARSTISLPFKALLKYVSFLLSENGTFSVIIPFREELAFIKIANEHNLYPVRICHVKGSPDSNPKRVLIEFSRRHNVVPKEQEMTLEISRHQYTDEYISLVKDFYLKM